MSRNFKYTLIIFIVLFELFTCDSQIAIPHEEYVVFENEYLNRLIINKLTQSQNTAFIDDPIEKFRSQHLLKGMAVAIVKDEKLVFAKGYGYADEEDSIRANPDQLFRLGSVSKLITALGIMKLVENSKISLDSKVFGKHGILNDDKFLHIRDKRLEKVTVRNLLNHSGGWTQRYGDLAFLPKVVAKANGESLPINVDSYIKFVTTHRLHFEPGNISVYSNLGYIILGKVVSKVSGMDYESFIRKNVLLPAGITDMQLGGSFFEDKLPNEVRYYQPEDAQPEESFDGSGRLLPKTYGGNDLKVLGAAGGWIASAIDLMKLIVVIDENPKVKDIISEASIIEMTSVNPEGLDPLGWRGTNESGEWWRTGTLAGASAIVKRQPDGISWVILSNTSTYKGPYLTTEIDRVMTRVLGKAENWPDYNLFTFYKR
jgi:CubicO group peptidase (beta-lactamase class C family)